jgi:hypothetical protein
MMCHKQIVYVAISIMSMLQRDQRIVAPRKEDSIFRNIYFRIFMSIIVSLESSFISFSSRQVGVCS